MAFIPGAPTAFLESCRGYSRMDHTMAFLIAFRLVTI
jgi:hypothetical protein